MTREELLKQAAEEYDDSLYREDCFIAGAKWADKHPKKGFVDIEKVCDYLKNLGYQRYPGAPMERIIDDDELEDLRKAMEE